MALLSDITSEIGFMPTGCILPFAGSIPPPGWLFCSGGAVSRLTYSKLFSFLSPSQSCNTNNSSTTVTVTSVTYLSAGMIVFGSGIPLGATVVSVGVSTVVISAAATATAIGVTLYFGGFGYGNQQTGGSTFNLPDFRGMFLRGVGGSSANDPDKTLRNAMNTGGNIGNNVGSIQGNATKKNGLGVSTAASSVTIAKDLFNHSHGYSDNANLALLDAAAGGTRYSGNASLVSTPRTTDASSLSGDATGSAAAQGITFPSGDNETRPLNAYVNYIIKT